MAININDKTKAYDPFAHRNIEEPSSYFRSTANLIKGSLGSGLLAVPLAFANSGWLAGIVGTFVIGWICTHCVQILVETSRSCCVVAKKPFLGYSETCKVAFANGPKSIQGFAETAKIFVDCALLCTHIGICSVSTLLISESIKQVADEYFPAKIAIEFYCLIIMVPLAMLVQIKHLKFLAPLSMAANILMVITFGICLYYIFNGELSFEDRVAVNDFSRFPAFLSTIIFAIEGIGVVMPIENQMKNPGKFLGCPGVLVTAMVTITVMYAVLGFFGYIRYGAVLRGSITLNLPMDEWISIFAKLSIALMVFLSYPLQFYVIVDIFERHSGKFVTDNFKSAINVIMRVFFVLLGGGIAIALPMLEQIISLVGAICFSILGLLLPCIIETVHRWGDLGKWNYLFWKNILISVFSIIGMLSGCLLAIQDILNA